MQKDENYRVRPDGLPFHTACESCSRCGVILGNSPRFIDPQDHVKVGGGGEEREVIEVDREGEQDKEKDRQRQRQTETETDTETDRQRD